jgi:hypothetical protein
MGGCARPPFLKAEAHPQARRDRSLPVSRHQVQEKPPNRLSASRLYGFAFLRWTTFPEFSPESLPPFTKK